MTGPLGGPRSGQALLGGAGFLMPRGKKPGTVRREDRRVLSGGLPASSVEVPRALVPEQVRADAYDAGSNMLKVDELVHRAAMGRVGHDLGAAVAVRYQRQRVVGNGIGTRVSGGLHQWAKVEEILADMKIGDGAAGTDGREDKHVVARAAREDIRAGAGFDDVVAGARSDRVVAVTRYDQIVESIAGDVVCKV